MQHVCWDFPRTSAYSSNLPLPPTSLGRKYKPRGGGGREGWVGGGEVEGKRGGGEGGGDGKGRGAGGLL